jgi:hypothetical protein
VKKSRDVLSLLSLPNLYMSLAAVEEPERKNLSTKSCDLEAPKKLNRPSLHESEAPAKAT